jgi:hypothetical protein
MIMIEKLMEKHKIIDVARCRRYVAAAENAGFTTEEGILDFKLCETIGTKMSARKQKQYEKLIRDMGSEFIPDWDLKQGGTDNPADSFMDDVNKN